MTDYVDCITVDIISRLRPGCSVAVAPKAGVPKPRRVGNLLNLGFGTHYSVHDSNLRNAVRGIVERVLLNADLVPPPDIADGAIHRLDKFARHLDALASPTARLTREEFVGMYKGRKMWAYLEAARSLEADHLTERDAYIKAFIKAEKINFTKKSDPAPRIIQPRDPRYNVELGRYLKHLEPRIFKTIRKVFGGHTVFKGMNALETGRRLRAKWDRFADPVGIGLDASRFDQHVRPGHLRWEHARYQQWYPGDAYLKWILSMQLKNRGVAHCNDGSVRYVVDGCRMSGDMNTSLGNCLLMCALVWSYCDELQLQFELANNGDDCVVIVERRDVHRFTSGLKQWFLEMGFTMKVEEPVDQFERVEFCQAHPIWTPEGWIMVRDITAVDKDLVAFGLGESKQEWLNACRMIGECGLHLAGHIPVYTALYRSLFEAGQGGRIVERAPTGMDFMARGLDNSAKPVHPATRHSFHAAFGLEPDVQEEIEQTLKSRVVHYQPNRDGIQTLIDLNILRI